MPVYEYRCNKCHTKFSIFMHTMEQGSQITCPSCKQGDVSRIFSSFAIHHSIKSIHEKYADPRSPDYYKDPRNIGRQLEKRFKEMNMEVPAEIKQKIESAREGVMPEALKDLNSVSPDATYH